MEQAPGVDIIQKAQALLTLRDSLGSFFEEQKNLILEQVLNLSLADGATLLKKLVEISFISQSELATWSSKLIFKGSSAEIKGPAPVQRNNNNNENVLSEEQLFLSKIAKDTKLDTLGEGFCKILDLNPTEYNNLLESLQLLNVLNVENALDLQENDSQFQILNELLEPLKKEHFYKVVNKIKESPFMKSKIEKQATMQVASSQTYHLWNADAQILFVPLNDKLHFYCSMELGEGISAAIAEKTGEHVLFYLDISASMNHDEKRVYCAPKSRDHPASSIKKARNLIAPLTLTTLKRNGTVTIVVWNFKILPPIEFKPEDFTKQDESGELLEDEAILTEIRKRTSEDVFVAAGGTNIESALKDLSQRLSQLAPKVSNLIVWFLTDGEETIYLTKNGQPDRIPNSNKSEQYSFFNLEDETGMTKYQQSMIKILADSSIALADQKSSLDFHVCHLGEAHPIFLKSLREAVDGHFHTFVDVSNMGAEMFAASSATNSKISLFGASGKEYRLPAMLAEGALCSRGDLPISFLADDLSKQKSIRLVVPFQKAEIKLESSEVKPLPTSLKESISVIIQLEPALGDLLAFITNGGITASKLAKASRSLKELRTKRSEAVSSFMKTVRSGTLLQVFLETILQSVETQIESLHRLLEQYQKPEADKYNLDAAKKTEMFSQRDQMAIEAGLESMRVRLGHGFVTQSFLDKKIQGLVALHGSWARRMLHRMCLIAETVQGEHTLLTLIILENYKMKDARNLFVKKMVKEKFKPEDSEWMLDSKTQVHFEEKLSHDVTTQEPISNILITWTKETNNASLQVTVNTLKDLYTNVVATYSTKPLTDDLDEACRRLIDPLSVSSFLDLIRENNTLPAYLYVIADSQSIGVLFNAKELLYVISGGSDSTSFDYFRLYWRLQAKNTGSKLIQVPGTFSKANSALPIAPEPLTNLVLSNLMPGLLSEFITGTPMAPLTAIGDVYIGYLMCHMKNNPLTGVDITRIAEILATLGCWIDNPKTFPKPEEYRELVDTIIKTQSIPNQVSPGKHIPVKALAYFILDDKHSFIIKHRIIVSEIFRRYYKLFLVPSLQNKGEKKLSDALLEQQIVNREFISNFLKEIAENLETVDDIPVKLIEIANFVYKLIHINNAEERKTAVLDFLSKFKVLTAILNRIYNILFEKVKKTYPKDFHWPNLQRLLFVWFALAQFPIQSLKDTFAAFKAPVEFEQFITKSLAPLKEFNFENTLCSFIIGNGHYCTVDFIPSFGQDEVKNQANPEAPTSNLVFRNLSLGTKIPFNELQTELQELVFLELWSAFLPALQLWHWKGRTSNLYGTSEVDFDIVKALKDSTLKLVETLPQGQLSEYYAAKEYRNLNYSKYVGPKPEGPKLSTSALEVAKQETIEDSGKKRLSLIMIGNVDAGKSTTSGHLIYLCGRVDKRTLDKFASESAQFGKSSFKFAWIMDRLRAERERGLTIETTMWNLISKNYDLDLIDAPGHRSFIKNMAVGASMADAAILIVSAAPNEFEIGLVQGGMTKEEALLAYTCGIRRFIVAVNKMDSVKYSEERFKEVSSEIIRYLVNLGLSAETIPVVPISGWIGDNLVELSTNMPWYNGWTIKNQDVKITGNTLFEAIDALPPPTFSPLLPLRIPILKAVKIDGVGTVAIGRVASGVLQKGQNITIVPLGITTKAESIERYHIDKSEVLPGNLVGFKLKNVSVMEVERGMVACDSVDRPLKPVSSFIAKIVIINHPGQISQGYCPNIYCHTATFPCRFAEILKKIDKKTGDLIEEKPNFIKTGDCAIVKFQVRDKPQCLESFQEVPALGRFAIRDLRITVGVGVITSIEDTSLPPKPKVFGKNSSNQRYQKKN